MHLRPGAGATGRQATDARRHGVRHGGGDLEGPRPGGVLERAQADLRLDRMGLGRRERGLEVRAGGQRHLLPAATQCRGAVDDVEAVLARAGERVGLTGGDLEGVLAGLDQQGCLARGDDRHHFAAAQLEVAAAGGVGQQDAAVLVDAQDGAVHQAQLGEGAPGNQQHLAGAQLGARAQKCPFGQVLRTRAGRPVDGGQLGDGVGDGVVDGGRGGVAWGGGLVGRGLRGAGRRAGVAGGHHGQG